MILIQITFVNILNLYFCILNLERALGLLHFIALYCLMKRQNIYVVGTVFSVLRQTLVHYYNQLQ